MISLLWKDTKANIKRITENAPCYYGIDYVPDRNVNSGYITADKTNFEFEVKISSVEEFKKSDEIVLKKKTGLKSIIKIGSIRKLDKIPISDFKLRENINEIKTFAEGERFIVKYREKDELTLSPDQKEIIDDAVSRGFDIPVSLANKLIKYKKSLSGYLQLFHSCYPLFFISLIYKVYCTCT